MPIFKAKERETPQVDFSRLPRHVAIIMDGNGRWAKRRGLPRTAGHAAGAEPFRTIATYCKDIGLEYLTVYAFSTENWKRPAEEVSAIMGLLKKYLLEAIGKMEKVKTGDTLCDEKHPIVLEKMEFPEPVIKVAIEPKTKAGQEKMVLALVKLAEEDPTFKTYTDTETGQTIIAGMGELHLEIIVDRLLREYKVEANVGAPHVAYKETIKKSVEQDTKYARQSGGKGQYGHVKIRLAPNESGQG